ncbi:MAG: Uncharacterised protein [Halieaceae bacterium]|nr:MAG: Uncharacterised protein [Halieaceae bacterium]
MCASSENHARCRTATFRRYHPLGHRDKAGKFVIAIEIRPVITRRVAESRWFMRSLSAHNMLRDGELGYIY